MFRIYVTFSISLFFIGCQSNIKSSEAEVIVETGTEVVEQQEVEHSVEKDLAAQIDPYQELYGYYVGYFERDDENAVEDKTLYVDEGFVWTRENKINISIEEIVDGVVRGRSVVAGNDRPFEGSMEDLEEGYYTFKVAEPGDDRYDGVFQFIMEGDEIEGTWEAYKDIDIKKRKYTLEKRAFAYNPDITLEETQQYVNWDEKIEKVEKIEMAEDEFDEWVSREFATATDLIYSVNASNTLLKKEDVENLKKGDLTIIRNTIYARHGYSFKNRPLRVFFDAQPWYIPVHTDIKADFTDLEKENIALMLRFEKNAAEYYDHFGRG